ARGLHWPPHVWGGPRYFRERLRNLELGPDPELRDSACITEASSFGNHPACLRDMERSPDPNARRSATLYLTGKDDLKVQASLEGNPLSFGPPSCADHIQEMLEIYADDIR